MRRRKRHVPPSEVFFHRRRGRGDVVRQLEIRAERVGELVTDVETAVAHADQAWVHVNAGLPCNDGSAANPRRDPSRLMEHVATFFLVIQRLSLIHISEPTRPY